MRKVFIVFLFCAWPIASAFSCWCVNTYISRTKEIFPEHYIFEASLVCDYVADEDFVKITRNNWFVLKVHRYWGKQPSSIVIGMSDLSNCAIRGLKSNTKYLIASRDLNVSQDRMFMNIHSCNITEISAVPANEFEKNGEGIFLDDSKSDSTLCRPQFSKLRTDNDNLQQELSKLDADLRAITRKYPKNIIYQASPALLVLLLLFIVFKNKVFGLAKMWLHTVLSSTLLTTIFSLIESDDYMGGFFLVLIAFYVTLLLPSLLLVRKNIRSSYIGSFISVFLFPLGLSIWLVITGKFDVFIAVLSPYTILLFLFFIQYRKQLKVDTLTSTDLAE